MPAPQVPRERRYDWAGLRLSLSWAWQFHTGWPDTSTTSMLDTIAGKSLKVVETYGPINSLRLPVYKRLDLRVSREWRLRHGVFHAFLDFFNALNSANPYGYNYGYYVRGNQLVVNALPRKQIPFLPSFGVSWEF